ncbi:AraC family transcriptional regulator [Nocardia suismassiliense]|uniref:AraC family transcriptional regulator n=1 Tax=Nocardia suismassiliense TaxID=2077092 RepID=UPI000D1F2F7A|nr:AraC family transcriptional regulator [Nocardia suismassiliense]
MELRDSRFNAATIPPVLLTRLCDVAAESGVDTASWFAGTGVLPERLDLPQTWVSYRQATAIIRRAVRALPEGPIGLTVGARNAAVGYGLLGFAMRSCRTVADATAVGFQLRRLIDSLLDIELSSDGELSTIQYFERIPDPELVRFLCEQAMAAAMSFARSLLGDDTDPVRIRLSYPEPAYAADYRRFFRCPIEFDCAVNELVFPTQRLETRLPTYSEASRSAALDACRQLGGDDTRQDIVVSVESILAENLRSALSMAQVADRLFVTERTLRRHLHAAGEKFSDIRDRVRQRHALFLVRETGATITQIAVRTGYRDVREFRRAYVRWNGEPPSRTRNANGLPRPAAANPNLFASQARAAGIAS